MGNLAIKGHATRGEEVIEILGMLGGSNAFNHTCNNASALYYIDKIYKNFIICAVAKTGRDYRIFTLEEFREKFPYKVGDRVRVPEYESEICISKMYWDGSEVQYEVVTDEVEWYSAKELNEFNEPNKEKTMGKEKNDRVKWDLPNGYEFQNKEGNVINTDVIKLVKKQSHYPKTYEECCKILGCKADYFFTDFSCNNCDVKISDYEDKIDDLLQIFRKLRYCRDAYWKLAGEQMGLGKPWEPDYIEESYEQGCPVKYVIYYTGTNIIKERKCTPSYFLSFPTEEMRDAFFENFGHLIELCKELL